MEKGNNIFLIGFMGCGKSTISQGLVDLYGMTRLEMDKKIEEDAGMTISEIFARKGEKAFRDMETQLIRDLPKDGNFVVSCGGGVPMREENVLEMREKGRTVWLKTQPETIYKRVRNSHDRPLLEGNMNIPYITELLSKRTPRYEAASDFTVDTDDRKIEEICSEINQIRFR